MKNLKLIIAFIYLPLTGINIYSQDQIIIDIIGESTSITLPENIIIEISFEENGRTCGPNTDFETVGEQVAFFFNEFNNQNFGSKVKFEETIALKDYANMFKKTTYSFTVKDEKTAFEIFELARYSFAEKFAFYYQYPISDNKAEIDAAHQAFENAQSQAMSIKNALNKKSVELISIDDQLGWKQLFYVSKDSKGRIKSKGSSRKELKKTYQLRLTYRLM